jgi:hypothetical protein
MKLFRVEKQGGREGSCPLYVAAPSAPKAIEKAIKHWNDHSQNPCLNEECIRSVKMVDYHVVV